MENFRLTHVHLTEEKVALVDLLRGSAAQLQVLAILIAQCLLHRSMFFWIEPLVLGSRLYVVGHYSHYQLSEPRASQLNVPRAENG
jgi:hypothetical protein